MSDNNGLHIQDEIYKDGLWFSVYDGNRLIESFRFKDDAESYVAYLERDAHWEDPYYRLGL
jgi:hypothetical protein